MLVRIRSNKNSHLLLVRMQNGADTSEDSLVDFFQKLAHPFHMIGQYCSLVFMQKNENLCLHKSLHMDIYTALFIIAKT